MRRVATYRQVSQEALEALKSIEFGELRGEYIYMEGNPPKPIIRQLALVKVPFDTFKDPTGCWNVMQYDIKIRNSFTIKNPSLLFGGADTAVADENALLGVALRVLSKDSEHREVKSLTTFSRSDQPINIDMEMVLKKGEYRRNITLEYVLYMEKPGVMSPSMFAKTQGAILGIIKSFDILLSGEELVFSTLRASLGRAEPLWTLQFASRSDELKMLDEDFSDVIQLVFNSDHKAFNQLQLDGTRITYFSLDILADSIHLLLLKFREAYESKKSEGSVFQKGSVGQVIHWFVDSKGMNFNLDVTPEELSFNIRKKIQEHLKNEMESL